ncbi:hypothetical protein [Ekhidna sp.]|uniref:hypothetical protein n=1 Tax=Ekhidna sp. TaxID=2608089 RepID=UPI003B51066D
MSKLFKHVTPTTQDLEIVELNRQFYMELNRSLIELSFEELDANDLIKLGDYIRYVFYYVIGLNSGITVNRTYRMVRNKSIIGDEQSLTKKRHLSYPPEHIVQKIGRLNRANSSNFTVFYGSETIDTALNELKPSTGELVSVGYWEGPPHELKAHVVFNHHADLKFNDISKGARTAYSELVLNNPDFVSAFLANYFELVCREFSKEVKNENEYVISSILAEDILNLEKNPKKKGADLLVYPSVGNRFITSNLAIKPEVFRRDFNLVKVLEFEVGKTYYDQIRSKETQNLNHENISIVEPRNLRVTGQFHENDILWN